MGGCVTHETGIEFDEFHEAEQKSQDMLAEVLKLRHQFRSLKFQMDQKQEIERLRTEHMRDLDSSFDNPRDTFAQKRVEELGYLKKDAIEDENEYNKNRLVEMINPHKSLYIESDDDKSIISEIKANSELMFKKQADITLNSEGVVFDAISKKSNSNSRSNSNEIDFTFKSHERACKEEEEKSDLSRIYQKVSDSSIFDFPSNSPELTTPISFQPSQIITSQLTPSQGMIEEATLSKNNKTNSKRPKPVISSTGQRTLIKIREERNEE